MITLIIIDVISQLKQHGCGVWSLRIRSNHPPVIHEGTIEIVQKCYMRLYCTIFDQFSDFFLLIENSINFINNHENALGMF